MRSLGRKESCVIGDVYRYVNAVISEDSDLLVFGCKRVLFKMNRQGNGKQICLRDLGANAGASFVDWTHKMFQQMVCFPLSAAFEAQLQQCQIFLAGHLGGLRLSSFTAFYGH